MEELIIDYRLNQKETKELKEWISNNKYINESDKLRDIDCYADYLVSRRK